MAYIACLRHLSLEHQGPIQGLPRSASDRDRDHIVDSTLCNHSQSKTRLIAIVNLIAKLGIIYATACHASLCTTTLDCLSVSCHCCRTALTTIYTVFQKNRTPKTFYYNFAKIALISIKIGTHNMHMT